MCIAIDSIGYSLASDRLHPLIRAAIDKKIAAPAKIDQ